MSSQYLDSYTPSNNTNLKCNEVLVRGHVTHGNIPSANIVQPTNITTDIDASAVANAYNFTVTTQTATTAAGGTERFFLNLPTGILNSYGLGQAYVYYYSGVVGTAGVPVLSIITQDAPNHRIMMLLENKHASNALSGVIHFRWSLSAGDTA
tara:strand:- start:1353 stop:1808 length:456 start_codon:yes stop_codon:yes gene_type:complete